MTIQYELWLTDDAGKRLALLSDFSFLTYTRAVSALGTCSFGMPFEPFKKKFITWFKPDWRAEVWRSPSYGIPMRREDVFLLRKPQVYTRAEDGMQIIQFYGRNGMDLLKRRSVIQRGGTEWATKTDFADDMMKAIVREQMLYGSAVDEDGTQDDTRAWPQGEFSVQGDVGLGPTLTQNFEGDVVFDVLKKIKEATFQKYQDDPDNNLRIFHDVVPVTTNPSDAQSGSPLGWSFVTRAGLYGTDRTASGIEFSIENENIDNPTYSISHMDEVNSVYVNGGGRGDTQIIQPVEDTSRATASRWNRVEKVLSSSNETTNTGLQDKGSAELEKNRPRETLPLVFLNTPGSRTTPRSLYAIDWDLGDAVRVSYIGKQFTAEINIVYVSVNESGQETITGRNDIQNAG